MEKITITQGRKIRVYRWVLLVLLTLCISALAGFLLYQLDSRIPSTIYLRAGVDQDLNLGIPATGEIRAVAGLRESNIPKGAVTIDLSGPVNMQTGQVEAFDMKVCLFGIIPVKKVDIRVIEDTELIPVGVPVGIYMQSDGILVVGIAEFQTFEGENVSPAKDILKSGDYIQKVNGKTVETKEELIHEISGCKGNKVTLFVKRDTQQIEVTMLPQKNSEGVYKAGIWVRDNAQGVGTMTYLDGSGNFGALGHGITDVDTGLVIDIQGGTLYQTEIVNLKKGSNGEPGEMTGRIIYADQFILGEIRANSSRGIFGTCNTQGMELGEIRPVPIGLKQEIHLGKAQIISTIENEPEYFDIEITKLHLDHDNVNRGIEIKVTDPDLIERTGGIVQGMSGSPILQDGKIIGAVTHVLVHDPSKGYGIFIENMLEE